MGIRHENNFSTASTRYSQTAPIWAALTFALSAALLSPIQVIGQGLRKGEYDAVAVIYNNELSKLGRRALFPICIDMPVGAPTKPLLEHLRRAGLEISDEVVCEPATARGGQHHPKDYPHGLRLFLDNLQRYPGGTVSMRVEAGDLTVRPGEHLAQSLRRGTYLLKHDGAGVWQITGYTKEYDYQDDKTQNGCDCSKGSAARK